MFSACRAFVPKSAILYRSPTRIVTYATSTSMPNDQMEGASTSKRSAPSIPRVVVRRTRQSRSFREGNPLVFPGAIAFTMGAEPKVKLGSLVGVEVNLDKDKGGKGKKKDAYPHHQSAPSKDSSQLIGWGVYNPGSMYRVRILCHATTNPQLMKKIKLCKDDEDKAMACILEDKLDAALQTRLALMLPSDDTDTYRLVNGEGDGLSGLAVDILGGKVAVVMSSAAWVEIHKEKILEALENAISKHPKYSESNVDIVWRTTPSRLKQDGFSAFENELENTPEKSDEVVITTESGVRYSSFPYGQGQKTGVYCDQRENRLSLSSFCKDKHVLDLCCYHGGFSLNALTHGGAARCTGVDSSEDAIETCRSNAELNGCSGEDRIEFVRADIANFMKEKIADGTKYDVIALDPPKLAPSVQGLDRASRKYHALNRDAIKLISEEKGGLLMTCTCSAAMTQKDGGQYFLSMVQQAAVSAGRSVTLLRKSGAASCHTQNPAGYPAGAYLTAALFHVSPVPHN